MGIRLLEELESATRMTRKAAQHEKTALELSSRTTLSVDTCQAVTPLITSQLLECIRRNEDLHNTLSDTKQSPTRGPTSATMISNGVQQLLYVRGQRQG